MKNRTINMANFDSDVTKLQGPCFMGRCDIEIIGDLTDDVPVFMIKAWSGSGYICSLFAVAAWSEQEALDKFAVFAQGRGWTDYLVQKDFEDAGDRPEASYDYMRDYIDSHKKIDDYTRDAIEAYLNMTPKDLGSADSLLEARRIFELIDLLEFNDINKRSEVIEHMVAVIDYVDALREYEETFEEVGILTESGLYVRAENLEVDGMSLDSFIAHVEEGREAA